MTVVPNRSTATIAALVAVFTAAIVAAVLFGGSLKATWIGIIASMMTPAIGAVVTMVVVQPLRAQSAQANKDLKEVKVLVNGNYQQMRNDLERERERAADQNRYITNLSEQILELQHLVEALSPGLVRPPVAPPVAPPTEERAP